MRFTFENKTVDRLNQEIFTAQRLNNLRLFKISKALLMISDGVHFSVIAAIFNVTLKTVYNWWSKFIVERFSWLTGHHYKGRGAKSRLSKKQKDKVFEIVSAGPETYGFDCGIWTSAMVTEVIFREFNVAYNPRYVCQLLKNIGLTFQKAAFEPDRTDKNIKAREEWENKTWPEILKRAKSENAVIIFGDEVSFAQWGSLSRTWSPKGVQPKIKTKGQRKGLKMFGVIEFFGGDFHYQEAEGRFNGESYIAFLEYVLNKYSCPVILVEDGASYHKGKIVKEFKKEMEERKRMFVYNLPSYSPDYNPIEKLWKNTKRDATHCKFFPTFEDLRQSVVKAFEKYMHDATEVIGVMNKLRVNAGLAA